ncbi:hypothetical protein K435DRAFT_418677 [Dendrothele bispora CBS 962.96]|uniref:Uncharacterized protein n=1 Tax=Dendrothele bispora (strain CBS 962.96) TaxID=1314807 RepID=A0A4S8MVC8_DENBC|nr:hypothetical protein K435DRAFT_418677 [Dendrothele bispora CBS 962.96]
MVILREVRIRMVVMELGVSATARLCASMWLEAERNEISYMRSIGMNCKLEKRKKTRRIENHVVYMQGSSGEIISLAYPTASTSPGSLTLYIMTHHPPRQRQTRAFEILIRLPVNTVFRCRRWISNGDRLRRVDLPVPLAPKLERRESML